MITAGTMDEPSTFAASVAGTVDRVVACGTWRAFGPASSRIVWSLVRLVIRTDPSCGRCADNQS